MAVKFVILRMLSAMREDGVNQNTDFRFLLPQDAQKEVPPAVFGFAAGLPRDHANRIDCADGWFLITLKLGRRLSFVTDWRQTAYFVSEEPARDQELVGAAATPADALAALINATAAADAETLEKTEEEISKLEERLMTKQEHRNSASGMIVGHRRKLLLLKQRYKQLAEMLDEVEEIEDGKTAAILALHRRVERTLESVLNLRDYLTEVRDAYQSNVELRQNRIMQTFTVIAAIFMPLQLVTGWFGMNLVMPEAKWFWTYPIVCAGCLTLVGILLFVFHRKKWL